MNSSEPADELLEELKISEPEIKPEGRFSGEDIIEELVVQEPVEKPKRKKRPKKPKPELKIDDPEEPILSNKMNGLVREDTVLFPGKIDQKLSKIYSIYNKVLTCSTGFQKGSEQNFRQKSLVWQNK